MSTWKTSQTFCITIVHLRCWHSNMQTLLFFLFNTTGTVARYLPWQWKSLFVRGFRIGVTSRKKKTKKEEKEERNGS